MNGKITNILTLFLITSIFSATISSSSFSSKSLYAESDNSFDLLKNANTYNNTPQKQSNNKILSQNILDQSNKIPNQYIVVFKNSVINVNSLTDQLSKIQANSLSPNIPNIKVLNTFEKSVKGAVFKISDIFNLLDIIHDPNVLYVEQDQKILPFAQQIPKGINRIDADLSYAISGNGAGTINADIAIIDSGISYNHPDLNIYKRIDFTG